MIRWIRTQQEDEGFTLIELLVVVIIIGILAAIAIPVFLNQRERAWNSAAQSDLRNMAVSQESYYTAQGGAAGQPTYTNQESDLIDEGFRPSAAVANAAAVSTDGQLYCMAASHQNSAEIYYLSNDPAAPNSGTVSTTDQSTTGVTCPTP